MFEKDCIKIVICDLDNTTLPAGQQQFSPRLIKAIQGCRKNGIRFMMNTGRHYRFIPPAVLQQLSDGVIVTINGACLNKPDGEVIRKYPMSEETMWRLVEMAEKNKFGLGFKFEDTVVSYVNDDLFREGYCGKNATLLSLTKDDSRRRIHHQQYGLPLGTFLVGPEETVTSLRAAYPDLIFAWSAKNGYDVFSKNTTKATGAEAALKIYGLTWDNVMAFGDAGNDLPTLEKAAYGFAMANAGEEIRRQAEYLAPACADDGVAQILEKAGLC